ncbi:hypothetical protein L9F63_017533, partial [Diploptera punctata]
ATRSYPNFSRYWSFQTHYIGRILSKLGQKHEETLQISNPSASGFFFFLMEVHQRRSNFVSPLPINSNDQKTRIKVSIITINGVTLCRVWNITLMSAVVYLLLQIRFSKIQLIIGTRRFACARLGVPEPTLPLHKLRSFNHLVTYSISLPRFVMAHAILRRNGMSIKQNNRGRAASQQINTSGVTDSTVNIMTALAIFFYEMPYCFRSL